MLRNFFIELRVGRIKLPNHLDVHVDCVLSERDYPHSIRNLIVPAELKQKIDILEPHDPSLSDNFEKAIGFARFAEKHGHLFGRIELIRKQSSLAGGKKFFRLNFNQEALRREVLRMTTNAQLDALFDREAS